MPISGDLQTMSVTELLQWAGGNRKTGILEIERNRVIKRIAFHKGRITGCASDDPSGLLGRFLVSRGKISQETLQLALKEHKEQEVSLPQFLVDKGEISQKELASQLAAKALETICGLFDWESAIFRFQPNAEMGSYRIAVNLSVEETLLKGAERQDELNRIRGVFQSSNVILKRADGPFPPEIDSKVPAFESLELIDGQRTLAEILLESSAPEIDVLRLLHAAFEYEFVLICGERETGEGGTLVDGAQAISAEQRAELEVLLNIATQKLEQADHEGALTVLDACYHVQPDDDAVQRLIASAEAGYMQHLQDGPLPRNGVPERNAADAEPPALQPAEKTLFGLIDGEKNIQALLWAVPLREIESLRLLAGLVARGVVNIRQPADRAVG